MIVTGDRDVFQLIDEHGLVKVMATTRGITDTKIYDRQAVLDRYGIPPELIPDFYGLKGDTSDNIPGVPGIGEKTASELIQSYGSLEDVLGHVGEIGGAKRKQNLLDHGEDARTLQAPGDRPARSRHRPRPRRRGRARARPLAPARVLPPLRAARPAAPPGGGARRGRALGGRPGQSRGRGRAARAGALGSARGHRPVRHRRGAVRGRA